MAKRTSAEDEAPPEASPAAGDASAGLVCVPSWEPTNPPREGTTQKDGKVYLNPGVKVTDVISRAKAKADADRAKAAKAAKETGK